MREAEFRAWLGARQWKGIPLAQKARNSRYRRCQRVERGLPGLGFAEKTLEEVFHAGRWPDLLSRLADLRRDPAADPEAVRSVVPQSENPQGQLGNLHAALTQYGYFLADRDPNYGAADDPAADDDDGDDEDLLARFDGDLKFYDARKIWSEDQRAAFCRMARAVHDAGLDWYHTNIPQIRFGRKTPEDDIALGTLGSIQIRRDRVFLVFSHQNERLGLRGEYPIDPRSADTFAAAIDGAQDAVRSWLPQQPPRPGFWPDEAGDGATETQAARIRQHVLERYIEPARQRGDSAVTVVVGPLNNEMGLNMAWPNICQALEGRKFRELARVPPPVAEGPRQSTTRKLTFTLIEGLADVPGAGPDPKNIILYGPPGTGKTYCTAYEAVSLCDLGTDVPDTVKGRAALMKRYRELVDQKRIAFVTFHQNYDYETFVEGLRPETGESEDASAGFRLEARAGIFREICALADLARTRNVPPPGAPAFDFSGRRFWKMGQGAIGTEDDVYEAAVAGNYVALGWGGSIDWSSARFSTADAIKAEWMTRNPSDARPSHWTQTAAFRCDMRIGDIVIVPHGNAAFRAIAEVTGDYRFEPMAEGYYAHRRDVRWLLTLDEPLPLDTIIDGRFTMRTLYELQANRLKLPALGRLIAGSADGDGDTGTVRAGLPDQFVLVIDEINRANISKVFGELITLIEPDKRLGMPNELTLTLPYSKKPNFGVPANLHIIGTMNTADRSIALLDTALRRRFVFREMEPKPDLLADASKRTGVDLVGVLTAINQRIEYLIDREHRIGHAFFMGCATVADVDAVMRDKVIPLLQEYFFEDWSRLHAVLGDGFIRKTEIDPPPGIDGDRLPSWSVRTPFEPEAYGRLTGKAAVAVEPGT